MFGMGAPELLIILVIVVLLFGAAKIPELGRSIGSGLSNFKRGLKEAEDKDDLAKRATSLRIERGTAVSRADVLADVLARIERAVDELERKGHAHVVTAMASRLAYVNDPVRVGDVSGRVRGITDRGGLLLLTPNGDVEVLSGHVERDIR